MINTFCNRNVNTLVVALNEHMRRDWGTVMAARLIVEVSTVNQLM